MISDSSRQLCDLLQTTHAITDPVLEKIATCINCGANPMVQFTNSTQKLCVALTELIGLGNLKAVELCLSSANALDFTVVDEYRRTPIHALAVAYAPSQHYNRKLTEAVVHRVCTHPEDKVDWGATDIHGNNFLHLIAENQLLSSLWPVVRIVPLYADSLRSFSLNRVVWEWDWNALESNSRTNFIIKDARVLRDTYATGSLWKACEHYNRSGDINTIKQCVGDGADVMFKGPLNYTSPILSHFLRNGPVEVVEVLLQSPNPIDFTIDDGEFGRTPLHAVSYCKSSEMVSIMLNLIVDRVLSHSGDRVSWGQMNNRDQDPISVAASWGCLSTWVQFVFQRGIPYYTNRSEKYQIVCPVDKLDWDKLSCEQKQVFEVCNGYQISTS